MKNKDVEPLSYALAMIREKEKMNKQTSELPEWIPEEAWRGYVEMRRKIKKPLTERAKKMAVQKLEKLCAKGYDPSMILDQSTFQCWQDLYAPKEEPRNGETANRKTFDTMRRESSAGAISRTVSAYQQMGSNLFGTPSQRSKRIGGGDVH